jgi:hypothetical protein
MKSYVKNNLIFVLISLGTIVVLYFVGKRCMVEKMSDKNDYNCNVESLDNDFGAASENNYTNKELWVKGASQIIGQLNGILEKSSINNYTIKKIDEFKKYGDSGKELKSFLDAEKSDKSTAHNYHILYSYVFGRCGRKSTLRVLEVGLGTDNPDLVSSMGKGGTPGASVRAFRNYLPNAEVFGADIDRDILFSEYRIKTAYVDQLNIKTFEKMYSDMGGKKFDVIIDDGLHSIGANLNTLLFGLDNINVDGWVIVEDIAKSKIDAWKVVDSVLKTNPVYETYIVDTNMWSWMYVVHKIK